MALTSRVTASITGTETGSRDLGTASTPLSLVHTVNLASGTGNSQADLFWDDTRTLTTGQAESLDLAGVLTKALGGLLTVATLKAILVSAATANTTNLTVGGGATTVPLFGATAHSLSVRPGGAFLWVAPNSGVIVTATSADLLEISNAAGASATYSIMVLGTSA